MQEDNSAQAMEDGKQQHGRAGDLVLSGITSTDDDGEMKRVQC